MFSQVSVCPQLGRRCTAPPRQTLPRPDTPPLQQAVRTYWNAFLLYSIFTGRNEVVAKVIFLHLSVILFTGGVVSHKALRQTPPPRTRHTSPLPPPDLTPSRTRHTNLPPPQGSRLRHTVYGAVGTHPTGIHFL